MIDLLRFPTSQLSDSVCDRPYLFDYGVVTLPGGKELGTVSVCCATVRFVIVAPLFYLPLLSVSVV